MSAQVLVIGNEKGGTGKSTISLHLVVYLLDMGLKVASVDLDARQGTLSRYLENRRNRPDQEQLGLGLPEHHAVLASNDPEADAAHLLALMADLTARHDVVVIDTPGADNPLSRLGHSFATTLITPLNDSLVDLDVLARVDPVTMNISKPSHYADMVWESRKIRALRGEKTAPEWIVLRNRLSHLDARNKRDMEHLLTELAKRVGFRTVAGLGERVIYRELFLEGLTLLDLPKIPNFPISMSHVAARQELRRLVDGVGLAPNQTNTHHKAGG